MAPGALLPADQDQVDLVMRRWRLADDQHKDWRVKASRHYALYRSYKNFRHKAGLVDRRDRDDVVRQAQREWGAELFIPYAFSTVETVLPRMLSNQPRMLVLPRDEEALGNVNAMKLIVDAQQEQCRYERVLQDVAKDGLIYGLGVQKVGWKYEERVEPQIVQSQYDPQKYVAGVPQTVCKIDDAWAWRVDPWMLRWDPYAGDIDCCEFVIEQAFRSPMYVERMFSKGAWTLPQGVTLDDVLRGSSASKRAEALGSRLTSEGYSTQPSQGDDTHEVFEFHDGNQVITVLDQSWPVQQGPNPVVPGELPYQVYRPTPVPGRIPGIGEIEPIEDLQEEINDLRSTRRDAARFALQQSYAYDETAVDADDLANGIYPGSALPVNGDPRTFLFPLPLKDIPASSVSEEGAIKDDMDRTSGISDTVTGASSANETATGVQLVQAAAGQRIANKTRLLEIDVIVPGAEQWIFQNQRRILTARSVPVPADPQAGQASAWQFAQVGPNELRGRMAASVEGGSTAPENTPQKRADAQFWLQLLLGTGLVDHRKGTLKLLELMDIKHPEALLAPQVEQLPADIVGQWAQSVGVPPQAYQQLMDAVHGQQQGPVGPQGGPPQGGPPGSQPQQQQPQGGQGGA